MMVVTRIRQAGFAYYLPGQNSHIELGSTTDQMGFNSIAGGPPRRSSGVRQQRVVRFARFRMAVAQFIGPAPSVVVQWGLSHRG